MRESFSDVKEYFASANSYVGFKSYFGDIFNSADFTAVYILKGGPGTGKSTILKKLRSYSLENNLTCEVFKCSSDPYSLDGVIIENSATRVAVIDGTAPHIRDGEIPGAVDELINLGEAFDIPKLQKFRNDIIELNRSKSIFYSNAYDYLAKSSVLETNIKAEISKNLDYDKCIKKCTEILKGFDDIKSGKCTTRLISSFSKSGYSMLGENFKNESRKYHISGALETDKFVISCMVKIIKKSALEAYVFPSALDENLYEGIFFKNEGILIGMSDYGYELYDSSNLLKVATFEDLEKRLKPLACAKEHYLMLAANELKKASECHFELEKIYTPCVNFGIIDEMYENLLSKIKNIFQTVR